MSTFVDSSALVKLYVAEPDNRLVRRHAGPFVISTITHVEVVSAFWLRHRLGDLTAVAAQTLTRELEADLALRRCWTGQDLISIEVDEALVSDAARQVAIHGLRGYDAVQLATARAARNTDSSCGDALIFDRALAKAATADGFTLLG